MSDVVGLLVVIALIFGAIVWSVRNYVPKPPPKPPGPLDRFSMKSNDGAGAGYIGDGHHQSGHHHGGYRDGHGFSDHGHDGRHACQRDGITRRC